MNGCSPTMLAALASPTVATIPAAGAPSPTTNVSEASCLSAAQPRTEPSITRFRAALWGRMILRGPPHSSARLPLSAHENAAEHEPSGVPSCSTAKPPSGGCPSYVRADFRFSTRSVLTWYHRRSVSSTSQSRPTFSARRVPRRMAERTETGERPSKRPASAVVRSLRVT